MAACLVFAVPVVTGAILVGEWRSGVIWPEVPKIEPGINGSAPSDAVVLFDGTNLDQWNAGDVWTIKDGAATARKNSISTKQKFGSCQLHLECAAPQVVEGEGQYRGNSGVFFGGRSYEVQILDSWDNPTYPDGQCGSIYKQSPPIVNPCRPPGQWQVYDIIYEAPQFGAYGEVVKPAYLTVFLNGVVVQNHVELKGRTKFNAPPTYQPHPNKMSILLQYHNDPVRFRNIWIRENIQPHQPQFPETLKWTVGDYGELPQE